MLVVVVLCADVLVVAAAECCVLCAGSCVLCAECCVLGAVCWVLSAVCWVLLCAEAARRRCAQEGSPAGGTQAAGSTTGDERGHISASNLAGTRGRRCLIRLRGLGRKCRIRVRLGSKVRLAGSACTLLSCS